jgi:hypothetical protein
MRTSSARQASFDPSEAEEAIALIALVTFIVNEVGKRGLRDGA